MWIIFWNIFSAVLVKVLENYFTNVLTKKWSWAHERKGRVVQKLKERKK